MTTSSDHLLRLFRQWLGSSETYTFLVRFVEIKSRYDTLASTLSASEQEDLCQQFVVFLLDCFLVPARLSSEIVHLMHTAQFRRILELAWGRFCWQQREVLRSKERNPRGYLYRRLRETLQQSTRFVVISEPTLFLCYAPAGTDVEQAAPFRAEEESTSTGYAHWLPPPSSVEHIPEKFLFTRQWLLEAAEHFWLQAMQRQTAAVAIPIRSLCRYIADHHPWLNNPLRQEGGDSNCTDQLADDRESPEDRLQRLSALQSVAPLAAQLAATWPMEQRQVFILRLTDPPLKYESIAERLGLADHNKAYAYYQKAVRSLQQFSGNWPGLPLSELPEEVARAFIEEIKRLCQKEGVVSVTQDKT